MIIHTLQEIYLLQYPSKHWLHFFTKRVFFFQRSTSATVSKPNKLLSHNR